MTKSWRSFMIFIAHKAEVPNEDQHIRIEAVH